MANISQERRGSLLLPGVVSVNIRPEGISGQHLTGETWVSAVARCTQCKH